ncbi:glycosyl transferase [Anoxybacterium hadale]|uniref:Glycosyl transferase n=1 Tax=Anoxybacterium hadale TaxID=3408580 RepID=A0ACD1AEW6_9FIRM|nr:glycosyl transferase [Clostridiales bacterium]
MKLKILICGALIILLSPVLGYESLGIVYANRNLIGEYPLLLGGFIISYQLVGILISIIGFKKTERE